MLRNIDVLGNMMKLQKARNNQYTLTIPVKLVEAKGWDKGKELRIVFNSEGNMVIEEVEG